ncbi:MAG: enoyl-CoA hydratase [Rhodospirillaceae bacterium]|nr:enoyl-CoA hydratase [Rhodospirillaceae bacterium]
MSGGHLIIRADQGGVRTLTLNRPEARNALSLALMEQLIAELVAADKDPAVQVIILAASGPAFCAGHDLKELRTHNEPAWTLELFKMCAELMLTMTRIRQPIIARVHGIATAAGCQLVATADLAVAVTTATFATPGVNIGLFCSTPMVALSRNVGRKKAMEMLLTGRPITAAEAVHLGLINSAVAPDALDATILDLAQTISAKSSKVLAIGKRAFYEQIDQSMVDAYAYASAVMAKNMLEPDAAEGIDAFLSKRKPMWAS